MALRRAQARMAGPASPAPAGPRLAQRENPRTQSASNPCGRRRWEANRTKRAAVDCLGARTSAAERNDTTAWFSFFSKCCPRRMNLLIWTAAGSPFVRGPRKTYPPTRPARQESADAAAGCRALGSEETALLDVLTWRTWWQQGTTKQTTRTSDGKLSVETYRGIKN